METTFSDTRRAEKQLCLRATYARAGVIFSEGQEWN